jgi:hypothetical protein
VDVYDPMLLSTYREEELIRRGLVFPLPYELPDGTGVSSGDSICTIPESVFFPIVSTFGGVSSASALRKRTRELVEGTCYSDSGSGSSSSGRTLVGGTLNSTAFTATDSLNMNPNMNTNANLNTGTSMGTAQYPADSVPMEVAASGGSYSNAAPGYPYAPNSLMQKLSIRADTESLTDLVYAAIAHADVDTRKELLGNIQIVGGGSLIQGLSHRLQSELNAAVPSHMKVLHPFIHLLLGLYLNV